MEWIKPLDQLSLADLPLVGSKAAHLGAMQRAGFPVPEGFVITVDAFVEHFGNVTDPLVKPPTPRLHPELMAQVVQALVEVLGEETEVAVRSSSTEEDGMFASFAGQHSTYYFVRPVRIDQAIVDCWMSLWSNAAINYRRSGWALVESGEPLRMAVIVQRMLPATRSGVVFSRHPYEASDDAVIEATWGLGAALVDGRVSPDHYRLQEDGEVVSAITADKQYQVAIHRENIDGARLQPVESERRRQPVLSTDEACHLATTAWQLETLFEGPQDVEWAYCDNDLYLLQSRPITTRHEQVDSNKRWVLFKPLLENFTDPLTPLSEDVFAEVLPKGSAFYQGRLYIDIDAIGPLIPFDLSGEELRDLALLRRAPEQSQFSWTKLATVGALMSGLFLVDGANWLRAGRMQLKDLARFRQVVERLRTSTLDLRQLTKRLAWSAHSLLPAYHQMITLNISAGRYFILIGVLNHLVKRFAPDFPAAKLAIIYKGDESMHSLAMVNALQHLSELAQAHPEIEEAVATGQGTLPVGHPFTSTFEDFLQEYGHRGPREMELAAPRWRETPEALLRMILSAPAPDESNTYAAQLSYRDELHQALRPWQRRLVDRLVAQISRFIALRENTRHYHVMIFDTLRRKALEIEREFIVQGALTTPGDIFFLTQADIADLYSGELSAVTAQQLVRERRRDWFRQGKRGYVEAINFAEPDQDSSAPLTGRCACPGLVEGIARVLHSPHDADLLQANDILIAPFTDPSWTPLFTRVAGIVVETGSFLSHAGTVARELNIPCAVDVTACTQHINSGQRIRLDATTGTVKILETS